MADPFPTLLSLLGDDISVRWLITVLHFLWQGAVVGAAAAIAGRLLRGASARSRYALYWTALLSLPVWLAVTFCLVEVPVSLQSSTQLHSSANVPGKLSAWPSQASATIVAVPVETGETTDTLKLKDRIAAQDGATMNAVADGDSEPLLHSSLAMLAPAAPWIALAYVGGAACFLLRLSAALWGGHRLRVPTAQVTDATILQLIADQADRVRLKCVPVVAYCERVAVPTVLGVLRPIVLLPVPVMTGLTPDEFAAIIRHELAHIRRYDLWMNLMQRVIESLLFFHPVVWWISRQISAEREVCCDDFVVSSGCEPMRYAGALLRVAELCAIWGKPGAPALSATGDETRLLERRIERLMNWDNTPRLQLTRAGMAGVMVAFVSLIVLPAIAHSWAQAQAPDSDSEPKQHAVAHDISLRDAASPANESATRPAPTEQAELPRNADVQVIRGTVVDQEGNPIAGAQLWHAYAIAGLTGKRLEIHATSNAAGQFTLEIPPLPDEKESCISALPGDVWIYSPGHCLGKAAFHSTPAEQQIRDLRVELSPATDTSLVILDPDGRPVPEALVAPGMYGTQGAESSVDDGPKQRVSGRTDAEGRVLLPALVRGRLHSVAVATEKYGIQIQRFSVDASEPAERTIRLRPVGRIEGRVIADRPEWIDGLRCTFITAKAWKRGETPDPAHSTEGYAEVTTDHQGRFAVPALAEGYFLNRLVQYDDRWPVQPVLSERPSRLEAGGTVSLDIPMSRPGRESKEARDAPPLTIDQFDRLGQLEEHATVVIQVPVSTPLRQSPDVKYVFELSGHYGLVLEAEAAKRLDNLGFDDPELRRGLDGRTVRATGTIRRYRIESNGQFDRYGYTIRVSKADAFAVLPIREVNEASKAEEKSSGR